jgi:hypothetical protein
MNFMFDIYNLAAGKKSRQINFTNIGFIWILIQR